MSHNRKIFLIIQVLWGLGLALTLVLMLSGCASPARLGRGGEAVPDVGDSPRGLAYYHYLKALRHLMAEDAPGAIKEYEAAALQDQYSPRLQMELALLYQRQGEVKKALAHAEKALKLDPKQPEVYFLLAGLHVDLNQLQEATREYERILVLEPDNREASLFLAALYGQQRQFPKAIRIVQELLRQEPQSVMAHYYLGRFYLEDNRLAEAKKELYRVLNMDSKFVPAMFDLGVALERQKQHNKALNIYRRILRLHPHNSRAWANIGRLFLIMHRYDDADRAFRKMKDLEKNDPAVFLNIGLIFLEQKLPESAILELRPLMSHPRLKEKARYYIALALEEKGDIKAAAREYQLVDRNSDHFIPARLRMAYLYYQQQDKAQAHRTLEEIKPLAPDREEIYLTLSYFLEDDKEGDKAVEVLNQALAQVQKPLEIHFRLAVLYEKAKNSEESIRHIKKVLELDPTNPEAQNFLGYTYLEAGINLDEAEKLIRSALSARPDSGHIIDSLGWLFFKKGQYDKAAAELERAHHLLPKDGTVAEHLGDAYFQLQRYREALRLYQQAQGLENANVPELRKKIQKLETMLGTPATQ